MYLVDRRVTEGRSESFVYSNTYWQMRADPGFSSLQFTQLW